MSSLVTVSSPSPSTSSASASASAPTPARPTRPPMKHTNSHRQQSHSQQQQQQQQQRQTTNCSKPSEKQPAGTTNSFSSSAASAHASSSATTATAPAPAPLTAIPSLSPSIHSQQHDELEALSSIYAQDFQLMQPLCPCSTTTDTQQPQQQQQQQQQQQAQQQGSAYTCAFKIILEHCLEITFKLPFLYPEKELPVVSVTWITPAAASASSSVDATSSSSSASAASLPAQLASLLSTLECTGDPLCYSILDVVKEKIIEPELSRRAREQLEVSNKRKQEEKEIEEAMEAARIVEENAKDENISSYDDNFSDTAASSSSISHRHSKYSSSSSSSSSSTSSSMCPSILSGSPLTDRRSTFQAHVARVHTLEEVHLVLQRLYENNKIARATHNMFAYTIMETTSAGMEISRADNDDDGEEAAGARLAHLLHLLSVRNLLVVVSRWYGGIHLGPDRFKHINSTARETIEAFLKKEKEEENGNNKNNNNSNNGNNKKKQHVAPNKR